MGRVRELGRCPVLVERLGTCLWLEVGGGFSSNPMRGSEIGGLSARRWQAAGRVVWALEVSLEPVRELGGWVELCMGRGVVRKAGRSEWLPLGLVRGPKVGAGVELARSRLRRCSSLAQCPSFRGCEPLGRRCARSGSLVRSRSRVAGGP